MPKSVQSRTDWERVRRIADSDDPVPFDAEDSAEGLYDPNDDNAVRAAWSEGTVVRRVRGKQVSPTKQPVSIRLSPEVVSYFKAQGPGWQTKIDEALLKVVKRSRPRLG
jgi:uncharacterized protein (DUF4415 family)